MYTGIVAGSFPVTRVHDQEGLRTFVVALDTERLHGLKIGGSVSVSGVCLTVVGIQNDQVTFDAMRETLEKTTIGSLTVGDRVHIERSAKIGDEIGGHLMSGHVSAKAKVVSIEHTPNNFVLRLELDPEWMKYVFPKGFIAVDGASLTVVDTFPDGFTVHLIPETLLRTTFGEKKEGDWINIECDPQTQAIVETVRRVMGQA
ncbi:riboflavin synthase subunit alpha [Candidatus Uhrbacteria bacterium]|nr:riboflavin synthase subunit alpha [Candidatus Uhrbacteria bacterium]